MTSQRFQPVRVALVGAGTMGSLHARVVSQNPDSELACIVDPDEANGATIAERYGSRWVPTLQDFGPFDAVIVAAPTRNHLEWTHQALTAGKPTLVEKPIADELDDVLAVIEEARHLGIPLMCGFPERFNPAAQTMLDIIDEPIHITSTRHSPFAPRITSGVAFDLLIHDVDLVLRMATARLAEIKAHFGYPHPKTDPRAEDIAEASLLFDGGLVASLSASRVSQRKIRRIEVAELERLVEVDLIRQDVTVYRHIGADFLEGNAAGYRQQTVIDIPAIQYGREPLAAQLDHFLALTRGEADAEAELATLAQPHEVVEQIVRLGRRDEMGVPRGDDGGMVLNLTEAPR